jgi:plastocyanin
MNRLVLTGVVGAVVLFSACGDDGPDAGGAAPAYLEEATAAAPALAAASEAASDADEVVLADVACPPIDGYDGPVADEGIGAAADNEVVIDAGDVFFSPTCVVNGPGDTTTMTVANSGGILHNVSIADQDIDIDIVAGETIEVEFELSDEPLVFICKYHRTAGVVGAVIPTG